MWFVMEKVQLSYNSSKALFDAITSLSCSASSNNCDVGNNVNCVNELITKEMVDVNRKLGSHLPLHHACLLGCSQAVEILLRHQADPNLWDDYGRCSLHYAAEKSVLCVRLLIMHGADVDCRDRQGFTALHWATYVNRYDCVRALLRSGANSNALNNNGETPLSFAAYRGCLESLQILFDYNATADTRNHDGTTPLKRIAQTIAIGIGNTRDQECLMLILRSLGQFDLRHNENADLPWEIEQDDEIRESLLSFCANPRVLKALCRYRIRCSLGTRYLPAVIPNLPLPSRLQDYLMLKE